MINFAIVGMGHIANKHIEAIEKAENANLFAICDTNPARLDMDLPNVKKYTDLQKMLEENPEIHVVNICVPSGLHARLTKIVAENGRHIIVEKPMSLKLQDAEDMIQYANDHGVKLAVVHPNRFRPAIQKLREQMDAGAFGKLSHANATVRWNRNQAYYDQAEWRGTKEFDGGVLMNQAIHDLDLMLWLMGPVESVQAMAATRLRKIETEDVAAAVVQFKNGALGVIEAATTIYPKNLEESIAIFGETASVKISGRNANFIETWDIEGVSEEEADRIKNEIKADPFGKPGHQCIIEDMVVAVQENRNPIVTGEDGLAPVKLILAILESAETGKKVVL
ncbi:Gfo/Idh/MocA family oxidoreductase [Bacillus sp. DTU_2020_1000418_1_SI_GHA_SEK_038]|uniref:Gfo/Idh/MocA family protein n=1 Tax=Bacillus sp. DTU_2020_1000418_1_SI_GHA_SEK_038 TaxID=3077585 RepID=UPI0028F088E9|nr:Gfo/Idh/MocA family oxidoreductase [Bacillus sp. DTU_2020_1000418_1_SI_GHA_SEK_038]WNS75119.1 Gfo/Idh/MocA family oxidoreductase [Bacillus sp. DTU_2020_1000418_1_SI_GHA_SEK_038]